MGPTVVLAGAGSTYFSASFVSNLLASDIARDGRLVLFDLDPERLQVTTAYARRVAAERGQGWTVDATVERRRAVEGADFVVGIRIVEVVGVVGAAGVRPLRVEPLPLPLAAMTSSWAVEQGLTVEAALGGNRRKAVQALMVNPTVDSIDAARALLDDLIAAQAAHLPQFR